MENKEENSYKESIKDTVPLSNKYIAKIGGRNQKNGYHAQIVIEDPREDLPIV